MHWLSPFMEEQVPEQLPSQVLSQSAAALTAGERRVTAAGAAGLELGVARDLHVRCGASHVARRARVDRAAGVAVDHGAAAIVEDVPGARGVRIVGDERDRRPGDEGEKRRPANHRETS
jgi:hypothetical protein